MGESGRGAYDFDHVSIVPSRRTRDVTDVDVSWQIDASTFDLPSYTSAMDSVVAVRPTRSRSGDSVAPGCSTSRACGRFDDPEVELARSANADAERVHSLLAEIYAVTGSWRSRCGATDGASHASQGVTVVVGSRRGTRKPSSGSCEWSNRTSS